MPKRDALTQQTVYQKFGSIVLNSVSAVGLNVAIGSILGVTGALKDAPKIVLRMLPGLGSAINYIMATKLFMPLIHPQLHAFTADQLEYLLLISRQDAEDLLAQRKSFKEVRNVDGRRLDYDYLYECLNRFPYALSRPEIELIFPESLSWFHTKKWVDFGDELLRLGTAAAVSYALPLEITESQEADGVIKGITAIAAADAAAGIAKGVFIWFQDRTFRVPAGYAAMISSPQP